MDRRGLSTYLGKRSFQENVFIIATLAPALLVQFIFVIYPVLYSLYLSLHETVLMQATKFVGLKHYIDILSNSVFRQSLVNTLYFTAGTAVAIIPLGLLIANALNGTGKSLVFFRTGFFMPVVMSYAAFAVVWYWLFDPRYGMINFMLSFLGIHPVPWIESGTVVIPAFILMNVWKRVGFAMVVFLAGLQTIPEALYEAATVDGANNWTKFRFITLPSLVPMIFFVTVITVISCLQLFVEPFMMTKGGPAYSSTSVVYLLYQFGFRSLEIGKASAMAYILFIIIFLCTILLQDRFSTLQSYQQ